MADVRRAPGSDGEISKQTKRWDTRGRNKRKATGNKRGFSVHQSQLGGDCPGRTSTDAGAGTGGHRAPPSPSNFNNRSLPNLTEDELRPNDGGKSRTQRGNKSPPKSLRPLGRKPPKGLGAPGGKAGRRSDSKIDGRVTKSPSTTNRTTLDDTAWPMLGELQVPTGRSANERRDGTQEVATSGKRQVTSGGFSIQSEPAGRGSSVSAVDGCKGKKGGERKKVETPYGPRPKTRGGGSTPSNKALVVSETVGKGKLSEEVTTSRGKEERNGGNMGARGPIRTTESKSGETASTGTVLSLREDI